MNITKHNTFNYKPEYKNICSVPNVNHIGISRLYARAFFNKNALNAFTVQVAKLLPGADFLLSLPMRENESFKEHFVENLCRINRYIDLSQHLQVINIGIGGEREVLNLKNRVIGKDVLLLSESPDLDEELIKLVGLFDDTNSLSIFILGEK